MLQETKEACAKVVPTVSVSTAGYISSHVTYSTGCGSIERPWVLRADPGQRINVTLLDFGFKAPSGRGSL